MRIPKKILGYTLTPEERVEFIKNKLTRDIVRNRIEKYRDRSEWFKPRKMSRSVIKIYGHIVTEERQELMNENGVSMGTARQRMQYGMTFDEATTTPLRVEMKMPKQEVIEVIGRIKYLNKQPDTIIPYCIPLGVKRRAKEYGIDIDKVKELPV